MRKKEGQNSKLTFSPSHRNALCIASIWFGPVRPKSPEDCVWSFASPLAAVCWMVNGFAPTQLEYQQS
jgi:hypothetical protein